MKEVLHHAQKKKKHPLQMWGNGCLVPLIMFSQKKINWNNMILVTSASQNVLLLDSSSLVVRHPLRLRQMHPTTK